MATCGHPFSAADPWPLTASLRPAGRPGWGQPPKPRRGRRRRGIGARPDAKPQSTMPSAALDQCPTFGTRGCVARCFPCPVRRLQLPRSNKGATRWPVTSACAHSWSLPSPLRHFRCPATPTAFCPRTASPPTSPARQLPKPSQSCAKQGYVETAVLVDADGVRQAVLRGDRAGSHTLDSAFDKAYTAASFKADTSALFERAKTAPDSPTCSPNCRI
jgi:hypothetical protein